MPCGSGRNIPEAFASHVQCIELNLLTAGLTLLQPSRPIMPEL